MDLGRMQPVEPPQEIPNFEEEDETFLTLNDDDDEIMYGLIPVNAEEVIAMMLLEEHLQEQALLQEQIAPGC